MDEQLASPELLGQMVAGSNGAVEKLQGLLNDPAYASKHAEIREGIEIVRASGASAVEQLRWLAEAGPGAVRELQALGDAGA